MQRFSRIERIAIGAVMDDQDLGGPKSQSDVDDFATFWSIATSLNFLFVPECFRRLDAFGGSDGRCSKYLRGFGCGRLQSGRRGRHVRAILC